MIEWNKPFTHVTAYEYTEDSSFAVLPEWYYKEQAEEDTKPTSPSNAEKVATASSLGKM